jgi:hypothetical protein
MEAKMDINLKEMKEEMLAKMEARIEANNEKHEVLRDMRFYQKVPRLLLLQQPH